VNRSLRQALQDPDGQQVVVGDDRVAPAWRALSARFAPDFAAAHDRDLPKILVEATLTTGSIMLIVASANLLGYVFARERIPQEISEAMLGLTSNPTVFLLLVFLLSMVLGTALDAIAVLTLTVPILLPLALQYAPSSTSRSALRNLSRWLRPVGVKRPRVRPVLLVG
jgi:hypothetical protein